MPQEMANQTNATAAGIIHNGICHSGGGATGRAGGGQPRTARFHRSEPPRVPPAAAPNKPKQDHITISPSTPSPPPAIAAPEPDSRSQPPAPPTANPATAPNAMPMRVTPSR